MNSELTNPYSLSSILKVYPYDEPRCLGYAPSYRRRCMNPTNSANRSMAASLLEQGTEMLEERESIDEIDTLLEQLAPLLLCVRYHRSQASGLTSRFKERVYRFLLTQREVERDAEREDEREAQRQTETATSTRVNRERSPAQAERSTNRRAVNLEEEPRQLNQTETNSEFRDWLNSVNTPMILTPEEIEELEELRGDWPVNIGDAREPEPSSEHPHPVNPPEQRKATRKPIEGDCGICILPLLETHCTSPLPEVNTTDDDSDGGRLYEDYYDEDDGVFRQYYSDSDDEEGEEESTEDGWGDEDEPLVWCKAQCGTNYHRDCLNTWLLTFDEEKYNRDPTCPTCRAVWDEF